MGINEVESERAKRKFLTKEETGVGTGEKKVNFAKGKVRATEVKTMHLWGKQGERHVWRGRKGRIRKKFARVKKKRKGGERNNYIRGLKIQRETLGQVIDELRRKEKIKGNCQGGGGKNTAGAL